MTWLIQISRVNPLALAFLGAHFVVYATLAWLVLGVRLCAGRMKAREYVLLVVWLGLIGLELVQLAGDGRGLIKGETWGLPRYFGVFAPLLWIWLARLCALLWRKDEMGKVAGLLRKCRLPEGFVSRLHLMTRALVVAALAWVFWGVARPDLKASAESPVRRDVVSAAYQARQFIQSDYTGPRKHETFKPSVKEYYNDRRPVVFSDFGYAAWLLRTQSEGADTGTGLCPYTNDYLYVRMQTGYGKMKSVSLLEYDYVTNFTSRVGCKWGLFRRKGVPHREPKPTETKPKSHL